MRLGVGGAWVAIMFTVRVREGEKLSVFRIAGHEFRCGKLHRATRPLWAVDGLLFPYRIGEELPTKLPLCETWARMSHPDPNGGPDRRPIKVGEVCGEVWENPVRGERSVILERPWDNPASRVTGELTALVGARVMEEHRHPALVEQFTVLEGALSI